MMFMLPWQLDSWFNITQHIFVALGVCIYTICMHTHTQPFPGFLKLWKWHFQYTFSKTVPIFLFQVTYHYSLWILNALLKSYQAPVLGYLLWVIPNTQSGSNVLNFSQLFHILATQFSWGIHAMEWFPSTDAGFL